METTTKTNSLTTGVIWKSLVLFVIPIMISSLFQQLYSAADTIIVGRMVGDEALAAVGATSSLTNMVIGFFLGVSAGAGVVVAQYYGAEDGDGVSRSSHNSIMLALTGGLFLTVVGILLSPSFMRWTDCPDNVFDYAVSYLRIIFAGSIPNLVYNMGSGILRASGDSKRPLYYLAVSIVLNLILDVLLVGPLGMGIEGAAWATILSQTVSALLTVTRMIRTRDAYRLHLRALRLERSMVVHILRIGIPTGMQSVAISFSNLLVQAMVNGFGSDLMAAWTAFNKVDNFVYMPLCAFGIAITTFVGQNVGAKRFDRAKKGVNICMAMALVTAVVCSVSVMLTIDKLLGLFSESRSVIEYGTLIAKYVMPLYFMYGIIEVLSGALKGIGKTFDAMIIMLGVICGLRVVYLLITDAIFHTIEAMVCVYPFTWTIASALFIIRYRSVFFGKKQL